MNREVTITALTGIKLVEPGDDLGAITVAAFAANGLAPADPGAVDAGSADAGSADAGLADVSAVDVSAGVRRPARQRASSAMVAAGSST